MPVLNILIGIWGEGEEECKIWNLQLNIFFHYFKPTAWCSFVWSRTYNLTYPFTILNLKLDVFFNFEISHFFYVIQ